VLLTLDFCESVPPLVSPTARSEFESRLTSALSDSEVGFYDY